MPSEVSKSALTGMELWGGLECTVNRVGNSYCDQLEYNGHRTRLDDLDRFADLGIRALRYPVLWETTAPNEREHANWAWADERLNRLRELGIRPIVGLIHHGSGPHHTSLVDPNFAEGLAQFAGAVAARYPWVTDYTPVNEPLTTARFSGLYGHWYPHGRDEITFARALLNQCRAVVLSMRAIRKVNPAARLVQTDDLGKTFSTPALEYQARFENIRRWLTFDLLCGRVDERHRMCKHLRWLGIEEAEIRWFLDNPCPPDVIGINHYLTSERFLDERVEHYPEHVIGGNGHHSYADVEAVRVVAEGLAGTGVLLQEAWDRYKIPLAVTEAHLGCTREEQMRWFLEVWNTARDLHAADGVDIRAVTAWSLLGAYDWNSLLTKPRGYYEPGVFDLRTPGLQPRPTALAGLMQDLAAGRAPDHPVLSSPGWWRRPTRLEYPPVHAHPEKMNAINAAQDAAQRGKKRPLLITGGGGTLADAFARLCDERGLAYRVLSRRELDIASGAGVEHAIKRIRPWAVVNAAGYVSVDAAETEPYLCYRANTQGPVQLAAACAAHAVRLLTFSSAMVFDGAKDASYVESDPVCPLCVYGRSKAEAEARVRRLLPSALIIRTGAFFGPWDDENFVTRGLRALAAGLPFVEAGDSAITPAYLPDVVHTSLDLLIDGEAGIWHLTNSDSTTPAEMVRRAAQVADLEASGVEEWPLHDMRFEARRPAHNILNSERGILLPSLEDALVRYVQDARVQWQEKGLEAVLFHLVRNTSEPQYSAVKR